MTRPRPPLVAAYRLLTRLAAPLVPWVLERRRQRGKEDGARLQERYGRSALARPAGALVWIHAASVGETIAALPLAERLTAAGVGVLLTTVTVTGARLAAERLPQGARHQFLPVDTPGAVARFLRHWRPDLGVFIEQEVWPNLILEAEARQVPLVLANARVSERSAGRWRVVGGAAGHLLRAFRVILAQSRADADRLSALGAGAVAVAGNLKLDVPPPDADPQARAGLQAALSGRPHWIAASTQAGDEATVLDAHRALRLNRPDLVLLLAPRHPRRADEVARAAERRGLAVARRSAGCWPEAGTAVFLLDSLGELGLLFRLGAPVFMGKSLSGPGGGQNPVEPARLACPVLTGPHVHNFADLYAALHAAGAAETVTDADSLAAAVARLLDRPELAAARIAAAHATLARLGGGLDATWAALQPFLAAFAKAPAP